jgi:hypothetical protein
VSLHGSCPSRVDALDRAVGIGSEGGHRRSAMAAGLAAITIFRMGLFPFSTTATDHGRAGSQALAECPTHWRSRQFRLSRPAALYPQVSYVSYLHVTLHETFPTMSEFRTRAPS